MAYVDEGPRDGQPVVMIHGNPTWSYMWRKLIPPLVNNGYRAIAIDLIGMGRSDKPTRMNDYTVARHEAWVKEALFAKLDLADAHFILHDWGGIIGLRAIADNQDRVAGIIMSNTGFPVRDPEEPITQMARDGAKMLRRFPALRPFPQKLAALENIAQAGAVQNARRRCGRICRALSPTRRYLTGNRQFTQMLPTQQRQSDTD